MYKIFIFFLIFSCFAADLRSQSYYDEHELFFEAGAGIGTMNCITDLGGANSSKHFYVNEMKLKNYRLSGSIYAALLYKNFIGARVEGTWGQVQSSDADVKGSSLYSIYERNRNLSFKSNIAEVSLLFEFHPFIFINFQDNNLPRYSPYIIAGVGNFSFNPTTVYQGKTINLQSLHTEGEGFPEYPQVHNYKLSQFNLPVGLGVRYELSSSFNLRLEYVHRILFTDYLDDASSKFYIDPAVFARHLDPRDAAYANVLYNPSLTAKKPPRRGNPNDKDTYMTLSLKVGVILGRKRR